MRLTMGRIFQPLLFLSLQCHVACINAAVAIPKDLPSSRCITLQRSLEKRGVKVDGIAIRRYSESERTMVATKDTPAGEVLLRMPVHLGVTASRSVMEYEAAADANLAKKSLGTRDADLLAIWLLSKRAEDSNRADPQDMDPYIASLPTPEELSHLPVYWDESDASWLMGSEAAVQLASRKKRETNFFRRLSKSSKDFSRIAPTLDSWIWAKSNIQSRAFSISNPLLDIAAPGTCIGEYEGEEEEELEEFNENEKEAVSKTVPALFPLADMVNHKTKENGCTCEWGIERETGDFLLRAIRDVRADAELSLSYGTVSSTGFLLNYGFVYDPLALSRKGENQQHSSTVSRQLGEDYNADLDDAECATFRLSLGIINNHVAELETIDDELRDLKTEIWSRDEGCYPDFDWKPMERVAMVGIGTVESAVTVFSLLRVGVATKEELFELMEDDEGEDGGPRGTIAAMLARNPFRWRNERETLRAFEMVIETQLKGFADMKNELDNAGGDALNLNKINASKAVQKEKQVLDHWLRIAKMAGRVLDNNRDSFDFGLQYARLFKTLLSTRDFIDTLQEDGS